MNVETIHGTKLQSKFLSECTPLQKLSFECLEKNNGDKKKCSEFFENYKVCKKEEHYKTMITRGGARFPKPKES